MADQPIKIGSTSYDIMEELLKIAGSYFQIDNMNILRAGLFGYITESMAHVAKDGIHHRNALYDELFLNTANFSKSIYNYAKIYNYNVENAIPGLMKINFAIRKKDIVDFGTKNNITQNIEFTIDPDDNFTMKKFSFMLENQVKIIAKPTQNSTDYSITAQYVLPDDGAQQLSQLDTPYIKTWIESINDEKWVFLLLDVWQMEKNTTKFTVFSEDIADNLFYDVTYPNQIAMFNVFYKDPKSTDRIFLPAYFNSTATPEVDKFCYYNYLDDGTLQISFSSLPNSFRPKFNSELTIEINTTFGSEGNFTYTGEILFKFKDPKKSKIPVLVAPVTDSAGGKNKPALLEIKQALLGEVLARGNLITEFDLDNFFNALMMTQTINNSSVRFIRKRDDLIKRLFSAYLLLRNRNGAVIPTNTVNFSADVSQLEKNNFVIPAGTIVIYDSTKQEYRLLYDDEYPEEYVKDDSAIIYSIPYLMNVRLDPFPRITYYKNTVNRDIPLNFRHVNSNINYEFIVNSINVKRNSILDDAYKVTLGLTTNLEKDRVNNNMKVRLIFRKGEKVYGYSDMVATDLEEYSFELTLNTDDTFDENGDLCLVDCVKDVATGANIPRLYVDEGISIQVGLLLQGAGDTSKGDDNAFLLMTDIDDYTVTNIFDTDPDVAINLFKSLNNVMFSTLTISSSGVFYISSVPVISSRYFSNMENYRDFYDLIDKYEVSLVDNFDKLENNTSIDLKFYNTYGISLYHSVDKVNLSIELGIRLIGKSDANIDAEIKQYIVGFVERSAEREILSVSNLITELETNFDSILFIEFRNINGVNIQKIIDLNPNFEGLSKEQIINYVPEFLNVGIESYSSSDSGAYTPNIKIEYI